MADNSKWSKEEMKIIEANYPDGYVVATPPKPKKMRKPEEKYICKTDYDPSEFYHPDLFREVHDDNVEAYRVSGPPLRNESMGKIASQERRSVNIRELLKEFKKIA